ncbi:MAG: DUF4405 domain-containing protein [Deltaproteobacteria bacterium]|nr:DUF4405 domain-containing protein [Deltaproteobacteria bacterium]
MDKQSILRKVNAIMAVVLLLQPLSGFLLAGTDWEFFEGMHVIGGITLLAFAAIHLWLNWGWVRMNFLKKAK